MLVKAQSESPVRPGHGRRRGRDAHPLAPFVRNGTDSWSVACKGDLVEIGFGRDASFPQYAAIHTGSGFLRLNHGTSSDWGTSIILPPAFWENGKYHQGAVTSVDWCIEGSGLRVSFGATISSLRATGEIRFEVPGANEMSCAISVQVHGAVDLDERAAEAFKPVMLSSMHVAERLWDVRSIWVDGKRFTIPDGGWIVHPAQRGRRFVLVGGESAWKKRAPSTEIELDRDLQVTGWKNPSSDPNDDNVGFWATADSVLRSWRYVVTVTADRHS